jgi:Tol biopolymer transport system component
VAKRLTTGGLSHSPRWSPSGKLLAYNRTGDIWVMSSTGSSKRQLTSGTAKDREATWSSDGSKVAFIRYASQSYSLWTVPATGGTPTLLTKMPSGCSLTRASWSPIAAKIVYQRDCKVVGGPQIVMYNVATKRTNVVIQTSGQFNAEGNAYDYNKPTHPDFTADGAHIIFEPNVWNYACFSGIWRSTLDGNLVEPYGGAACECDVAYYDAAAAPSGTDYTGIWTDCDGTDDGYNHGIIGTGYTFDETTGVVSDTDWQPIP